MASREESYLDSLLKGMMAGPGEVKIEKVSEDGQEETQTAEAATAGSSALEESAEAEAVALEESVEAEAVAFGEPAEAEAVALEEPAEAEAVAFGESAEAEAVALEEPAEAEDFSSEETPEFLYETAGEASTENVTVPEPIEDIVSPEPTEDIVSPKPTEDIISPEPTEDIISPEPGEVEAVSDGSEGDSTEALLELLGGDEEEALYDEIDMSEEEASGGERPPRPRTESEDFTEYLAEFADREESDAKAAAEPAEEYRVPTVEELVASDDIADLVNMFNLDKGKKQETDEEIERILVPFPEEDEPAESTGAADGLSFDESAETADGLSFDESTGVADGLAFDESTGAAGFSLGDGGVTEETDALPEEPLDDMPDMSDMDALLKSIQKEETEETSQPEGDEGIDIGVMSQEQIEALLSANSERLPEEAAAEEAELSDLLGDSGDSDLQSIQELLSKAERNEAVDESVAALLAGSENEVSELSEPDSEELTPAQKKEKKKQEKALAKQRKAEERARKLEERARKAEEKRARKAGKKAETDEESDGQSLSDFLSGAETANDSAKSRSGPLQFTDEELAESGVTQEDLMLLTGGFLDMTEEDSAVPDAVAGEGGLEDIREKEKSSGAGRGFFSRLIGFLTEEDDSEEGEDTEEIKLSDENREILDEMDKEGDKKKKSKKKAKKGKGKEAGSEDEDAEDEVPDKKAKAKKEKKPKKEKPPKPPKEYVPPAKRLTIKKMLPIFLMAAALLAFIVIGVNLYVGYSDKRTGKQAYYAGDYQTCYQNLYGKNLTESEQVMFGTSESILCIRLWMKEYELFVSEGSEERALDSLLQSVSDYPTLYGYASQWNAGDEVAVVYAQILAILSEKYGLTESAALEIAALPDDVDYTREVLAITDRISGNPADTAEDPSFELPPLEELPDVLPEEEELPNVEFMDNM